ncbi:hypothetical protein [Actinokineospora cianjurensis]|uniref:hypothetical protein n=1 Tax=Actinokineospora cianjurensis TaxID=585224 RepID=UPI000EB5B140|nr:hypothetical protein [Actinokineospora cianjurensis]
MTLAASRLLDVGTEYAQVIGGFVNKGDALEQAKSHVEALLRRYRPGKSVAEIEREAGLRPGLLAQHVKPSKLGRGVGVKVLERFRDALGAPLSEVSSAFFADAGVHDPVDQAGAGVPLTPQAMQFGVRYSRLTPSRQRIADGLLGVLEADQATAEQHRANSIAPEISITPNI